VVILYLAIEFILIQFHPDLETWFFFFKRDRQCFQLRLPGFYWYLVKLKANDEKC
jgi:hypothetical protein